MYYLHSFPDRFVLFHSHRLVELSIERSSGFLQKRTKASSLGDQIDANVHSEKIDLVIGIITLLRCKYLVLGTQSIPVGDYHGFPVRQLTEHKILPFAVEKSSATPLTANQLKDEQLYLNLLHKALNTGRWYFSYEGDLTLSSQKVAEAQLAGPAAPQATGWQRADIRFFWNRYLCHDLIHSQADEFIIPLLNGYFHQQKVKIQQKDVIFTLFSRRSNQRAGKRFILRGADINGHVANFAETEQILAIPEEKSDPATGAPLMAIFSFLQTRGSIPVLWQQPVTLKYAPKIQILKEGKETELAFRRHFESQIAYYGKNICLNLVNQKGGELTLVQAFQRQADLANSPSIRLINWDFHHECRKMKYENINKLLSLIGEDFPQQGFFYGLQTRSSSANGLQASGQRIKFLYIKSSQKSIFRTNCIDCLDRTNVVQSVLAKKLLYQQLESGLGMTDNEIAQNSALESMFKNVWANNADAMSIPYSGTGALKTDYTRTGKRSTRGALNDGINSLTRYFLNNFKDGHHQDALDLFLGVYQPSLHQESPFLHLHSSVPGPLKRSSPAYQKSVTSFVWRFTVSMLIVVAAYSFLAPPHLKPYTQFHYSTQIAIFASLSFAVGAKLLLRYGRAYVSKPALRPKEHGH